MIYLILFLLGPDVVLDQMNSTNRRQSATKIPIEDPPIGVNSTDMYNNYYYQDTQASSTNNYYQDYQTAYQDPQGKSIDKNNYYHQDTDVPAAKSAACIIL